MTVLLVYKNKALFLSKLVGIHCLAVLFFLVPYPSLAVPVYDITTLGFRDAEHTGSDGRQASTAKRINEAGQVAGSSFRSDGWGYNDRSAWFYDGSATIRIGLFDAEHTASNGRQYSNAHELNESGQVTGSSQRSMGYNDRSAWFYDGLDTTRIGLFDAEHTNSDGIQYSSADKLNEAGQVIGSSKQINDNNYFEGDSAWIYDGSETIRLGFNDADHTNVNSFQTSHAGQLNDAGQVAGVSTRYNGSDTSGQSAWLYDESGTTRLGLRDLEHTTATGYQYSSVKGLNEAGQVIGISHRDNLRLELLAEGGYHGGGVSFIVKGQSAWIYNGSDTVRLGFNDVEYTDPNGFQYSDVSLINEGGQVAGISKRYDGQTLGSSDGAPFYRYNGIGQSAWIYSGSDTVRIGFLDAEHTHSYIRGLNEAGQVIGISQRKDRKINSTDIWGTRNYTEGYSAWVYDGSDTIRLGFNDADHTDTNGFQNSIVSLLNEAGQVTGISTRYNGSDSNGYSVWFYDLLTDNMFDLTFSIRSSDNYAETTTNFLSEDGTVLGSYRLFDDEDNDLGWYAYWWNMEEGFFDLGSLVDDGLTSNGWKQLYESYTMNNARQILGSGYLSNSFSGMAYLLTPQDNNSSVSEPPNAPVPEPSTMLLFGTGLAGFVGFRLRRKNK